MRRIGIVLAGCLLMASGLRAETTEGYGGASNRAVEPKSNAAAEGYLNWRKPAQETAAEAETEPEPEAKAAKPTRSKAKRRSKRRSRTASEPQRPSKTSKAEAQWWETVGNPAVFAFSECVAAHAAAETRRNSRSSYPDFVTQAMNGSCKPQFDGMAQLMLARHGEAGFRKIAKELIATTFMPAVKQAVETVQAEVQQKQASKAEIKAEMRQAKEAMLGCFVAESDRLAPTSPATADRLAQTVIASCRSKAELFFTKLHMLHPDAVGDGGKTSEILDASYRPAIVTRINSLRAGIGDTGKASAKGDPARISRHGGPSTWSPARASSRP